MKVLLVDLTGYEGISNIVLPAEVEAELLEDQDIEVLGRELIRIGGDEGSWDEAWEYTFSLKHGNFKFIN